MTQAIKENYFPELRKMVDERGLFEKKPRRSMISLALAIEAYLACFAILAMSQNIWVVLLVAVALTIVSGQLGFLMHDAGHRQVFRSARKNDIFGYIATFFNGGSFQNWMHEHNEHHNHPNHEDMDPDLDVLLIAYSEKQVDDSNAFIQYIVRYQAWFATILYTLVYYFMRYGGLVRVVQKKLSKIIVIDFLSSILWHIVYFGGLFALLGFWKMVIFVLVHHALTGLHFALVFAPNHKGMPVFENDANMDWFTRQVVTARNIYGHPLTNFLYGGLNFQIEHHLFPTTPRIHYNKVQKMTKKFCQEKGVDYCETSIIQAYKEVYGYLAEIGAYARNLKKPMTDLQEQFAHLVLTLKKDLEELKQCEMQSEFAELKEKLATMATDCIQRSKENHKARKEKLLLAQKEVRELSAAIRQYITPLKS